MAERIAESKSSEGRVFILKTSPIPSIIPDFKKKKNYTGFYVLVILALFFTSN